MCSLLIACSQPVLDERFETFSQAFYFQQNSFVYFNLSWEKLAEELTLIEMGNLIDTHFQRATILSQYQQFDYDDCISKVASL